MSSIRLDPAAVITPEQIRCPLPQSRFRLAPCGPFWHPIHTCTHTRFTFPQSWDWRCWEWPNSHRCGHLQKPVRTKSWAQRAGPTVWPCPSLVFVLSDSMARSVLSGASEPWSAPRGGWRWGVELSVQKHMRSKTPNTLGFPFASWGEQACDAFVFEWREWASSTGVWQLLQIKVSFECSCLTGLVLVNLFGLSF